MTGGVDPRRDNKEKTAAHAAVFFATAATGRAGVP
jgi:hypothetical protein